MASEVFLIFYLLSLSHSLWKAVRDTAWMELSMSLRGQAAQGTGIVCWALLSWWETAGARHLGLLAPGPGFRPKYVVTLATWTRKGKAGGWLAVCLHSVLWTFSERLLCARYCAMSHGNKEEHTMPSLQNLSGFSH